MGSARGFSKRVFRANVCRSAGGLHAILQNGKCSCVMSSTEELTKRWKFHRSVKKVCKYQSSLDYIKPSRLTLMHEKSLET